MGEYTAHMNLNQHLERPSFFELVAQDSMMSVIRPAVKHLLLVLAHVKPEIFGNYLKYEDEIYASFAWYLQWYYLNNSDASFAETFYGLIRVRVNRPLKTPSEHSTNGKANCSDAPNGYKNCLSLSTSDRRRSLICLALFPYIKRKLDNTFASLSDEEPSVSISRLASTIRAFPLFSLFPERIVLKLVRMIRFVFLWIYPYFNATRELVFFIYQLLYLYDHTGYYTPTLHFIGLQLKRLTFEDVRKQKLKLENEKLLRRRNLAGAGLTKWFLRHFSDLTETAVEYSKFVLPTTVFFFKFLQWWYASDYRNTIGALPVPPAPPKLPNLGPVKEHRNPIVCPLCSKKRKNSTVLSTSGYIFCYSCIFSYVTANSACPMTNVPSKTSHLVRLFTSTPG